MKVIIEEGDLGGLPPGVYEANEAGSYIDCFRDGASNLNINLNINLKQKPKPVPLGGRYDFEFWRFERLDSDVTDFEARVYDKVDPSKDYCHRMIVSNSMLSMTKHQAPVVEEVARQLTERLVRHTVENILENLYQTACKGKAPTSSTSGAITWVDLQVGSKRVRLTVGDVIEDPSGMAWTVTGFPTPTTWSCTSSSGHNYNNLALSNLVYDLEKGNKVIQTATATEPCNKTLTDPHGQPINPFIKALKQCEEKHTKDCDECYGTGRFKGFGGPCSQGCPAKGDY